MFVAFKTLLIASSAMLLYVVHFPPTTKKTPVLGFRETTCSLLTGAPGGACGSVARGRNPRHALRTSERRTCVRAPKRELSVRTIGVLYHLKMTFLCSSDSNDEI
jgi:hypothetical protein